jgi:lipopolysaccharide/colanic/teichoic acid biosynthesis glycosyltransferase
MAKRFLDIVVCAVVLTVLVPVLLIVAAAVAIESHGNPFYRGRRVGLAGQTFRMWKFRTMVANAASIGPPITGRDDPRVTRLGRLLRRTKLDELPQLFNVLAGDMTLVGPRPEAPEIVAVYGAEHRRVLSVKPGITGPVQLRSMDEADLLPAGDAATASYVDLLMDKKVRQDLNYLDERTMFSDARIIGETAVRIVQRFVWSLYPGRQKREHTN